MGRIAASVVLSACLLATAPALAGQNVGGVARLSWSRSSTLTDLPAPPSPQFPLFVLLENARDVQGLFLNIRFTPYDSLGECFRLVAPARNAGCGFGAADRPVRDFAGDSTATWTITFEPGDDRQCVTYGVSGADCEPGTEASFYLVAARVLDSDGQIDDLMLGDPVTIGGGSGDDHPPLDVSHLAPGELLPGRLNALSIRGTGFSRATRVELQSVLGTIQPTLVDFGSQNLLYAHVEVPEQENVAWSIVVVDSATGERAFSDQAYLARDTTSLTGTGINPYSGPIDKITRSGVFRKEPGSRVWTEAPESTLVSQPFDSTDGTTAEHVTRGAGPTRPTASQFPGSILVTDCGRRDVVFEDGFEGGALDTDKWVTDVHPEASNFNTWGVEHQSCAQTHGGGYSAHAASGGFGGLCASYFNEMATYLQMKNYAALGSYESYEISFSRKSWCDALFDGLRWGWIYDNGTTAGLYYNIGQVIGDRRNDPGNLNGWIQQRVTISNAFGDSSYAKLYLGFDSDGSGITGYGTFVDDAAIKALPKPSNLAPVVPPGASTTIVASWRQGTSYTDTMFVGETIYVDWAVKNVGQANVICPFKARLRVDGITVKDTAFVNGLAKNDMRVFIDTPITLSLVAGPHTIRVEVDYDLEVEERHRNGLDAEDDNTYQITPNLVWNNPPNLIVESIIATPPQGAIGSAVTVEVKVKNTGGFAAKGPFKVGFWNNRASAPTQGTPVDTLLTAPTISAGGTVPLAFSRTSPTPATWNMYAYADWSTTPVPGAASGWVPEASAESDNVGGPTQLVWTTPPVIVEGTFAFLDSVSQADRAIRCARVVIFDDDYGTPADDDTLWVTYCDASGHFGPISIPNQDADAGGPLDVYAVLYTESVEGCAANPRISVTGLLNTPWDLRTTTAPNVANGPLTLPTTRPSMAEYQRRAAMHIYGRATGAADWTTDHGNPLPRVTYRWFSGQSGVTRYEPSTREIFLNGEWAPLRFKPDEYDRDAVTHEYGHHAGYVLQFTQPVAATTDHSWIDPDSLNGKPNVGQTWSESWAGFFSGVVKDAPVILDAGNTQAGDGYREYTVTSRHATLLTGLATRQTMLTSDQICRSQWRGRCGTTWMRRTTTGPGCSALTC